MPVAMPVSELITAINEWQQSLERFLQNSIVTLHVKRLDGVLCCRCRGLSRWQLGVCYQRC